MESAHVASLHLAWPRAYMHRLWQRSSSLFAFEEAKSIFLERLKRSQVPEDVMAWISTQCNFIIVDQHRGGAKALSAGVGESNRVMWTPCVYHKALAPLLSRSLSRFLSDPSRIRLINSAFQSDENVRVRLAWRLTGSSFGCSHIRW